MSEMYLLAICHNRQLRSLRDLGPVRLPLLKKVRACAQNFVPRMFGIDAADLIVLICML